MQIERLIYEEIKEILKGIELPWVALVDPMLDEPDALSRVFLDLTEETGGNANGVGVADVVSERLASRRDRSSTYLNALTSTSPQPVKLPMVMPTDRLAIAATLEMCAGVSPRDACLVRVKNTLKLRQMHVSEALLPEVEKDERLRIVEEPGSMRFEEAGSLI